MDKPDTPCQPRRQPRDTEHVLQTARETLAAVPPHGELKGGNSPHYWVGRLETALTLLIDAWPAAADDTQERLL
ncbi:MAG TPA: hypothetical protein VLW50_19680 [Streptosporangiaceae bacterium]|nr:hypothetical protein [Streptosporangiaceae bacterium]